MTLSALRRPRLLLAAVLLLALAGGAMYWTQRDTAATPTFRTGKVERGPITATVSATGTLNPVTSVQVGTQVSGQIKELFVDFNSPVKKGQLIARIDPETFEYRVRQAQADAEAARSAKNRAQVSLVNTRRELDRTKELVAREFVSPAELDAKQAQFDLAQADVRNAQAVVAQREASLASARVDLGRTEIRAPVDGVVIKRSVDVGQTVAASLQAPELFIIAKDLRDMQVETSIDEADVGRIRIGQRASFTVDSFPGRSFNGEVKQVRKAAQNVQNVVTYTVLVTANNDAGQLMPGMTANVRIVTDTRESVLKAPNAALRFRPPGASAVADRKGSGNDGAGDGKTVPAAGGAGQGEQFRQRLLTELKLDAEQQARLDPILAQTRNKFMAARDLPEEQRGKALAAARSESRARIEEILRPEQKARYAELVAEQAGRAGTNAGTMTRGRVWVLVEGKPQAIDVRVGLTDGTMTEIAGDGIAEGTELLVGTVGASSGPAPAKGGPPRMFF
ncbi:MAG: efflux RND transporter periplasmic adaptor subunit [Burkholderiales bacterium]|jgi:HlyD family secretion protein|nr:efflux RND transporter periplasmic adaptor subunit [Burkholderiales bacterium]